MLDRKADQTGVWPMFLLGALAGVIIVIALLFRLQVRPSSTENLTMSYADLAAVMLGAVAVIVTVLGVFIAILAIYGYSQFRSMATAAASNHVANDLKDGKLRTEIEKMVGKYLSDELSSGNLRKMIERRVDGIVYSGAEDRAEEEEGTPPEV